MNSKNLISIIVPVYNVERYISNCIESLLMQTYETYEIILIDDGSTDNSREICQSYANKSDKVYFFSKKNEGLGLTRNFGIQKSKGEYITFVDSDDYVSEHFLENLLYKLIETSSDACIGGFTKVNDDGKILFKELYNEEIYCHDGVTNNVFKKMLGSSPTKKDSIRMSVWNSLYKTSIIKENLVTFPSEREFISEDIIFDMRYYSYAKKVIVISNTNYFYRSNDHSLSKRYYNKRFLMTNILFKYLETYLINNGFAQQEFLRLYRLYFVYIRVCLKQEKYNITDRKLKKAICNIKSICSDEYLQLILSKYPIEKLDYKQKIFLYAIKNKAALFLYIFL